MAIKRDRKEGVSHSSGRPEAKPKTQSAAEISVDTDLEWLHPKTFSLETEAVTQRIFDSVLAKHGWVRNERGELEHTGEKNIKG